MKTLLLYIITLFIFTGCSVKYDHVTLSEDSRVKLTKEDLQTKQKIETLAQMIQSLSPKINKIEAYNIAQNSIYYSMHLANSYDLVKPPSFQNFLVNQNLRQRGLCHQWASDILDYLKKDKYETIGIYKVISNEGDYFTEHHAISITARGEPYDKGIVLDAWRNSGDLYFAYVTQDKEYKWYHRKRVQ
ncbi:MAG: hypothetical protein RBR23_08250 [Arcobacteraceae bacterium]|jgi:hypothetical protein|nr:hypothetical protein [Arcobacteraceae bacterium]